VELLIAIVKGFFISIPIWILYLLAKIAILDWWSKRGIK
tara:strand:- start:166 stop:282 length:117 start_codon:yes stop_codon:yes gene_type:complete